MHTLVISLRFVVGCGVSVPQKELIKKSRSTRTVLVQSCGCGV